MRRVSRVPIGVVVLALMLGGGAGATGTALAAVASGGFNVAGATSSSPTSLTVTFDAAPTASQATSLANYSVPGLTLVGIPTLAGNTVTISTTAQAAQTYTVTVTGVTRAADATPLTTTTASFTGMAVASFNVVGATPASPTTLSVSFDAPPVAAQATSLANYSVPGLTLAGTPALSGDTVTLTTSAQTAGQAYTVTVTGVTRASDSAPLTTESASFTGAPPATVFDVVSASSLNATTLTVTFDAPPNASQATSLASYSVPGLSLSGTPSLSGNTVTLSTSAQSAQLYTVTVSGVTRASDGVALTTSSATFGGKAAGGGFNVVGATSLNATTVSVTFDAAPNPVQASSLTNYSISGLTLTGAPTVVGSTVTLTTSAQSAAQTYTVVVSGVTRASDAAPLTKSSAVVSHPAAPVCVLSATVDGPPKQIKVTVQDLASGIATISPESTNASVSYSLAPGTTQPVVVTATKVDASKSSTLKLTVTSDAGVATVCDPVVRPSSGSAPAAAAHVNVAHAGGLLVHLSARGIVYGSTQQVTLAGRVPDGRAGERVTVLARVAGFTGAAQFATVTTARGGTFAYRFTPALGTAFAVRWNGATSRFTRVVVQPEIAMQRVGTARYRIDVSTTNGAILSGVPVLVQRAVGSYWKTVARATLHTSGPDTAMTAVSSATVSVTSRPGRLRAIVPATAWYGRAVSATELQRETH